MTRARSAWYQAQHCTARSAWYQAQHCTAQRMLICSPTSDLHNQHQVTPPPPAGQQGHNALLLCTHTSLYAGTKTHARLFASSAHSALQVRPCLSLTVPAVTLRSPMAFKRQKCQAKTIPGAACNSLSCLLGRTHPCFLCKRTRDTVLIHAEHIANMPDRRNARMQLQAANSECYKCIASSLHAEKRKAQR